MSTFEAIFELLGQKYNQKSTLLPNLVTVIWSFLGPKKLFFGLFESSFGLELFRSSSGIYICFKRPPLKNISSLKGRYNTSKIKLIGPILVLWEGHFHLFQGQQTRSLGFLEVVLGLFFSLQIQLVGVFSAWRVDICPLKSIFEINFWPSKRATLTIFRVVQE